MYVNNYVRNYVRTYICTYILDSTCSSFYFDSDCTREVEW